MEPTAEGGGEAAGDVQARGFKGPARRGGVSSISEKEQETKVAGVERGRREEDSRRRDQSNWGWGPDHVRPWRLFEGV